MNIVIEKEGKRQTVDVRGLMINGISLDQVVARLIKAEKELNDLTVELKKETELVKKFIKKRF